MTSRDLRLLPKAELHLHLLGAMRPSTMAELSVAEGIEVPDPRVFADFNAFQKLFPAAFALCTARPENMRRLVREVVEDVASGGGLWLEAHFNPFVFTPLGAPDEVMELVLSEGFAAGSQYGVAFGLTMAASRHGDPSLAEELAQYSVRYAGRGVHALGLTGNDTVAPAADFAKAFAIAREGGLTAAPHAGELSGPADVRSAVEDLGARRIAHGVRAAEDPAVLEFLAARGVSLDVCPTSNLLLGVVPSLADHPLPRLLESGVRCSLGADDPLMFGVTVNDEYEVARASMGLTDEQLAAIARTSLETSDAPAEVVATGLAGVDTWLQLPGNIR